ncbi:hypothetical protein [Kribbella shirazensis]|uniref:DNA-directed RNA polymerase specialized sigma24 family protein n=1 Tax=Kribbella shirazensis TaxID=1105143 RepID=A0A7X5VHG2_9ACTN|nr:hypothetical protein [Kribbella shirazensis]NIK61365.1 DNA-directed RNA polymerase specialized sigma24 family protein [Kribbella shirazensis]
MDSGRAELLTAQLPHLYALASALDADAADDLVQETVASALADPATDTSGPGLAAALERLAAMPLPDVQSPVAPVPGMDPDADAAEVFYPDFYTDGPDAGAWVNPPVAWGEARVLSPDDALVTVETYSAVAAALTKLDPVDVGLLSLVDIESAPLSRAVIELGLSPDEARERLARARFAVRAALDRELRR